MRTFWPTHKAKANARNANRISVKKHNAPLRARGITPIEPQHIQEQE